MTLPGVEMLTEDGRPPTGPRLTLSTPFIVGELELGPDTFIGIQSLRDLQRACGVRNADTASVHDWVDGYFKEGGGRAYLTPLRGAAAAAASRTLADNASATALTVTARNKGAAGNRLSVDVDVSGTNFEIKIYRDGTTDDHIVERSGMVADGPAAAAWATTATWVTLLDGIGGDPVVTASPVALTGGDDDYDGITNTEIAAAFARFPADLGPGRNVLPGRTATGPLLVAAANGFVTNRLVAADGPPTDDETAIAAAAAVYRASDYSDRIDVLVPRLPIPGLAGGVSSRTMPPSALLCGREAANDKAGISPNQPAAGKWGVAQYATGVTQTWDDDARELLNDAGVTVVRAMDDQVKIYGSRTVADPDSKPAAIRRGSARLRMAIIEIARYQAEQTEFAELDQGGVELGNLVGLIRSGITTYQKSLYFLDVTAELVEDEFQAGVYLVEVTVEFQAAPDAERIRVTIVRQVTEV